MAAHRYWRVLCLDNGTGDTVLAIDEVDLRVNAAGSRLSITGNGSASASSTYPGPYSPAGAFDGVDFTTNPSANAWLCNSTSPFPHYVKWDFGAGNAQDINYVGIKNVSVGVNAAANSLRRGILQWSDDDVLWTSHIVIRDHPNTTGGYASYEYDATALQGVESSVVGVGDDGNAVGAPTLDMTPEFIDLENGGNGVISGVVKIDGDPTDVPVRRQVILLREPGAFAVRETWSDPITGAYQFEHINRAYKYTVLAYDYSHSYRAVLADNVTPDLMT